MYVFSASATATKNIAHLQSGEQGLFIVYIDFKDLFGAENLCKLRIMREGFREVVIEKRQWLTPEKCHDPRIQASDQALREALQSGWAIQLFEE